MNLLGSPVDYLAAFTGGVLVSFSPCVYPLIPVSLGYIGVTSSGKKLRGFALSLIYVSGLALVYALLGVVAALSGSFFGKISVHPLSRIIVGVVFIFLGLSLWGLFPLRIITLTPTPGINNQKKSIFSVFLLGATSALVISPCASPVLGSILIFVSTKQNLFYGVTLLLVFAYGLGFIFILTGTFSAFLLSIPKPGHWMEKIKKLTAAILICFGLFYIYRIVR